MNKSKIRKLLNQYKDAVSKEKEYEMLQKKFMYESFKQIERGIKREILKLLEDKND